MDPYKFIQVSLNPDGTLTRYADIPIIPPSCEHPPPDSSTPALPKDVPLNATNSTLLRIFLPKSSSADVKLPTSTPPTGEHPLPDSTTPALSKDVPLNTTHSTWIRIFLPKSSSADVKLPIILYFHGGGFILFSAASGLFPASSAKRAAEIPAIVISVEYRLAPEHRLPAAYDDAADALLWVRDQARGINPDPWLKDHADFSNCYVMGSSAGANIAYHLGLRSLDLDLGPLRVAGMILNVPYFGGEERTESEARSTDDKILPLAVNDLMWELSLPIGANRDHEYCNPMKSILKRPTDLPRCLVKGFIGDPLYDRQREFVKMMKEQGASVVGVMDEDGYHGIDLLDPGKAEALIGDCRKFIYGNGVGSDAGGD